MKECNAELFYNSTEKRLIRNIERKEGLVEKSFEFVNEVVGILRKAINVDKAVMDSSTYITIIVPKEFFLDDFRGSSYDKSIIETSITGFFKKSHFSFYNISEDYTPIGEHQKYLTLTGGAVLIPKWCIPEKVVNVDKLLKDINKLQQLLGNSHYLDNAPTATVEANKLLLKKKLEEYEDFTENIKLSQE